MYLERNLGALSNTRVVKMALSNYVGNGELYSSPSSAVHSMVYIRRNFVRVQVTTLDELVKELNLQRVDYIKMDAEGSDLNILKGAIKVLIRYFPVLSIACYHADPSGIPYVDKVVKYLRSIGYKCITEKGYIYAQKEGKQCLME